MDMPGQSNQENSELLRKLIERRECAVFIGAGISIPVGYPGLQQLLWDMALEADIDELKEKEITDDWMDDFQTIKDVLGLEQYRECLIRIFDHRTKDTEYSPLHLNMLNIPFCAYVTTNYDPCLEFAASNSPTPYRGHLFAYPNLPVVELKGEHIFHLHGYISPGDLGSVKSIVLSRDEYDDAYEEIVSTFLRTLFRELDVLFIGFGWNDLVILDTLTKVKRSRKVREDVATRRDFQLARERHVFAIIDSETYDKDIESNNYIGAFGVRPIIYNKLGDRHYLLNDIIQSIQVGTSSVPVAPMPSLPEGFLDDGEDHG